LIDDQSDSSIYKSPYAFRLIYNGRVLTNLMDGCPGNAELCDAQILVRHVAPFATRSIDCWDDSSAGGDGSAVWDTVESLLSKTAGLLLILFIMAMGGAVGGAGMFFYLTGTLPDAQSAIKAAQKQRSGGKQHNDSAKHDGFFGKSEIDADKDGRVGLMDEIEMTFTDAASPFDEYE
jgi:hypothetical protein